MRKLMIETAILQLDENELAESDRKLIAAAQDATQHAYAPYSNFFVGAAVLLADGRVIQGANQENAAFPSGMCAERSAIFAAQSAYPSLAIEAIAIAARNSKGFVSAPVPPCGACRQVMLEIENRYGKAMRILLYGTSCIYQIDSAKTLLPLSFANESMEGNK